VGSLMGVGLGVLIAERCCGSSPVIWAMGNCTHECFIARSAVAAPLLLDDRDLRFRPGAWLPARSAARQSPAYALKGGDAAYAPIATRSAYAGLGLLAGGAVLARLPPVGGLPFYGYLSVAALLFGAVLLVPSLTVKLLAWAPRSKRVVMIRRWLS